MINGHERKQIYVSGDAVWINDIKKVKALRKECGKKLNFFGRVNYYNQNSDKYLVEFKTDDNNFESFWIESNLLSSPNQFNDNTIGYYLFDYDINAVLDYEEFVRTKSWYKRERARNKGEGIMPISTINGNKKGK